MHLGRITSYFKRARDATARLQSISNRKIRSRKHKRKTRRVPQGRKERLQRRVNLLSKEKVKCEQRVMKICKENKLLKGLVSIPIHTYTHTLISLGISYTNLLVLNHGSQLVQPI